MPIFPARCTNCGANLQVDNAYVSMICPFCGCNFVIEQAVYNYNYNMNIVNNIANANINIVGVSINNLLTLAKNAEGVDNFSDALKYYNQALEVEPNNCDALLGKAINSLYSSDLDNMNINELIGYSSKAIGNKQQIVLSQNRKGQEYTDFLLNAVQRLYGAGMVVMSTAQINYNANWKLNGSALEYWNNLQKVIEIFQYVIKLTEDKKGKDFVFYHNESVKFIMDCCIEICKQREYVNEIVVSGVMAGEELKATVKPTTEDHKRYLSLYDKMLVKIKELEPDFVPKEINRHTEIQGGCYIATCVYGSYDCPEVWVLRRYRDYKLNKNIVGRLFVKLYYAISPKMVELFGNKKIFKLFWKKYLDKIVRKLKNKGYSDVKYFD